MNRISVFFAALLMTLFAVACDDATAPDGVSGTFALVSYNGKSVATIESEGGIIPFYFADIMFLRPDGTGHQVWPRFAETFGIDGDDFEYTHDRRGFTFVPEPCPPQFQNECIPQETLAEFEDGGFQLWVRNVIGDWKTPRATYKRVE